MQLEKNMRKRGVQNEMLINPRQITPASNGCVVACAHKPLDMREGVLLFSRKESKGTVKNDSHAP